MAAMGGIISATIMSMTARVSDVPLVDFHAHCLPALDDGAEDLATARRMLLAAAQQGAHTVVATPHFYWGTDTVASFLEQREAAYARLMQQSDDLPAIRLGTEVLLREGISQVDLRPLCLAGTDVLLVELPFSRPPYWLVQELEDIAYTQRLTVMLAHLDRYMHWYSAERLTALLELPDVIVQLNAETLADPAQLRLLRRWLPQPERLVLGSDMHDMQRRMPLLDAAVRRLSKKAFGRRWLALIDETTRELL